MIDLNVIVDGLEMMSELTNSDVETTIESRKGKGKLTISYERR